MVWLSNGRSRMTTASDRASLAATALNFVQSLLADKQTDYLFSICDSNFGQCLGHQLPVIGCPVHAHPTIHRASVLILPFPFFGLKYANFENSQILFCLPGPLLTVHPSGQISTGTPRSRSESVTFNLNPQFSLGIYPIFGWIWLDFGLSYILIWRDKIYIILGFSGK